MLVGIKGPGQKRFKQVVVGWGGIRVKGKIVQLNLSADVVGRRAILGNIHSGYRVLSRVSSSRRNSASSACCVNYR